MKPKTIAAIVMAAVTTTSILSCKWFTSKKRALSPYEKIAGTWKLAIDSANHSASKDSSLPVVEFRRDSVYYVREGMHNTDSGKFEIDTAKATFYAKHYSGKTDITFHIDQLSDSLILLSVQDKDSTHFRLTRKKEK